MRIILLLGILIIFSVIISLFLGHKPYIQGYSWSAEMFGWELDSESSHKEDASVIGKQFPWDTAKVCIFVTPNDIDTLGCTEWKTNQEAYDYIAKEMALIKQHAASGLFE